MNAWKRMEEAIEAVSEGVDQPPGMQSVGYDDVDALRAALRELKATTKAQLLGLETEIRRAELQVQAILEGIDDA